MRFLGCWRYPCSVLGAGLISTGQLKDFQTCLRLEARNDEQQPSSFTWTSSRPVKRGKEDKNDERIAEADVEHVPLG